jgi:hypothetical protein
MRRPHPIISSRAEYFRLRADDNRGVSNEKIAKRFADTFDASWAESVANRAWTRCLEGHGCVRVVDVRGGFLKLACGCKRPAHQQTDDFGRNLPPRELRKGKT